MPAEKPFCSNSRELRYYNNKVLKVLATLKDFIIVVGELLLFPPSFSHVRGPNSVGRITVVWAGHGFPCYYKTSIFVASCNRAE